MSMMNVDLNQGVIRFYAAGKSFENRDAYECSMSFVVLSDQTVFVKDALGRMSPERFKLIEKDFIARGFKCVLAYLPTSFKPFGFFVLEGTDLHVRNL